MFRFSLRTLVLLSLWAGAAMLVWRLKEPWELVATDTSRVIAIFDTHAAVRAVAPDRKRLMKSETWVSEESIGSVMDIEDIKTGTKLSQLGTEGWIYEIRFQGDDTIELRSATGIPAVTMKSYHRRFPEWWWGHLYRPEVWLLMVLTGALAWTFVRRVRVRNLPAAKC